MPRILSREDREEIRAGIAAGHTDQQIADQLGVHRCTVNREINRNRGRHNYQAARAQQRAEQRRKRPRPSMLSTSGRLRTHITERLEALDSPMTIAIELARGVWGFTAHISHETIYQAIYTGTLATSRTPHLQRRRRKSRTQPATDSHALGEFRPIHIRPAAATHRHRVGHLEGDLIVGAYNRSALVTVVDRKSRYLWLHQTASKRAADVHQALLALFSGIPMLQRRTLTWDQGAEIARWSDLVDLTGTPIFIADPKSPWQRPTNEHTNGLVRRYVGKGTDLSAITQTHLDTIAHRINTTPRRILNWDTPANRYARAVAATT